MSRGMWCSTAIVAATAVAFAIYYTRKTTPPVVVEESVAPPEKTEKKKKKKNKDAEKRAKKNFSPSSASPSVAQSSQQTPSARLREAIQHQSEPYGFSSITAEAEKCRRSDKMWVDPDFPHTMASLVVDPGQPGAEWCEELEIHSVVEWKSPLQYCVGKKPAGRTAKGDLTWLHTDKLNVNDPTGLDSAEDKRVLKLTTGSADDCYLLSVLAMVAQHPSLVDQDASRESFSAAFCRNFIDDTYEDCGIYGVALCVKGRWQMVWVDSHLPCFVKGAVCRPIFAQPFEGDAIWPAIMEKAFAKVHGSYQGVRMGIASRALQLLSAGSAKSLPLSGLRESLGNLGGALWKMLKEAHQQRHTMVIATSRRKNEGQAGIEHAPAITMQGLMRGRAYKVLCVEGPIAGVRLVQLHNPLGDHLGAGWTGDWSKNSDLWTTDVGRAFINAQSNRVRVRWQRTPEDAFWMRYEDFVQYFDTTDFCKVLVEEVEESVVLEEAAAATEALREVIGGAAKGEGQGATKRGKNATGTRNSPSITAGQNSRQHAAAALEAERMAMELIREEEKEVQARKAKVAKEAAASKNKAKKGVKRNKSTA
ncbi:hypothetical protein CYMTET_5360 [Cymbomonas tetramitiformis]|uniref:Calpain catalytic domain-containing protein n=1 Tax=Cymbomonas tetramitiformis TaxID=36881 RepID=A0AAE0LIZ4_9CHLO|nr:hypothetical protein CYMTET_5360 [Cymbomonas tetramitiformis]